MNLRHFIEKGFTPQGRRLGDEAYAQAIDSLVIACVDIILLDAKGEMLLGKRSYYPAKGWWIVGGRMRPGESFEEAAARNVKRELGLEISTERFSCLGLYSFVWAIRRQPPVENGSHTISVTMTLAVTDSEKAEVHPNEEYEEMKWWDPKLVAQDPQFLLPIRQYAIDILT